MPREPSADSAAALKGRNLSGPGSTAFSNREWARTWKAAARELEAVRRAEIKSADTAANRPRWLYLLNNEFSPLGIGLEGSFLDFTNKRFPSDREGIDNRQVRTW